MEKPMTFKKILLTLSVLTASYSSYLNAMEVTPIIRTLDAPERCFDYKKRWFDSESDAMKACQEYIDSDVHATTSIAIEGVSLSRDSFPKLSHYIENCPIKRLVLKKAGLTDDSLDAFLGQLNGRHQLETLDLSENSIQNLEPLTGFIGKSPTLKKLKINNWYINPTGWMPLLKAVKKSNINSFNCFILGPKYDIGKYKQTIKLFIKIMNKRPFDGNFKWDFSPTTLGRYVRVSEMLGRVLWYADKTPIVIGGEVIGAALSGGVMTENAVIRQPKKWGIRIGHNKNSNRLFIHKNEQGDLVAKGSLRFLNVLFPLVLKDEGLPAIDLSTLDLPKDGGWNFYNPKILEYIYGKINVKGQVYGNELQSWHVLYNMVKEYPFGWGRARRTQDLKSNIDRIYEQFISRLIDSNRQNQENYEQRIQSLNAELLRFTQETDQLKNNVNDIFNQARETENFLNQQRMEREGEKEKVEKDIREDEETHALNLKNLQETLRKNHTQVKDLVDTLKRLRQEQDAAATGNTRQHTEEESKIQGLNAVLQQERENLATKISHHEEEIIRITEENRQAIAQLLEEKIQQAQTYETQFHSVKKREKELIDKIIAQNPDIDFRGLDGNLNIFNEIMKQFIESHASLKKDLDESRDNVNELENNVNELEIRQVLLKNLSKALVESTPQNRLNQILLLFQGSDLESKDIDFIQSILK